MVNNKDRYMKKTVLIMGNVTSVYLNFQYYIFFFQIFQGDKQFLSFKV